MDCDRVLVLKKVKTTEHKKYIFSEFDCENKVIINFAN